MKRSNNSLPCANFRQQAGMNRRGADAETDDHPGLDKIHGEISGFALEVTRGDSLAHGGILGEGWGGTPDSRQFRLLSTGLAATS